MALLFIIIIGYLLISSNWEVEFDTCFEYENEKQIEICQLKKKTCDNDYCYLQKAQTFLNESACAKIKDEELKYSCYGEVNFDVVTSRAVDRNDVTQCDMLKDVNLKNNCSDNFYLVKEMLTKNKSYCDKIVREDLKNECQSN